MRKRLKPQEAELLGFEPKENLPDGNAKYSINTKEWEKILDFRINQNNNQEPSKSASTLDALIRESQDIGIDINEIKHGWLKSDKASFFFTNPLYKDNEAKSFVDELLQLISDKSPNYPEITRLPNQDGHLLIINPADIHLGKLASAFETGDDYNTEIAIQRVKDGVNGIIEKSKGFNIDKIIFVGGNDILHVDTPKATTTAGTFQNTDGMWYDNYIKAFKLYTEVLEMLIPIADVHFVYCPSNHDYTNGFFLCQSVEQYFRQNNNITFDTSIAHRKYYNYGLNIIGFTHGDGAKQADLPLLMAHESPDWGKCKHRYIYTHHLHHKTAKDFMSVCVEGMRSPSGTDGWHHRNGYQHAPKAVEGFIHHRDFGQIARLNHLF